MKTVGTTAMAKRWYIIHAYSNFENKVAESIREQAKQRGLSDLFEEVMVPKEKVVEVRRGRKVDAERKGRSGAHPAPGPGGHRAAEAVDFLRGGRAGPGVGWPVRVLQWHRGGGR